MNFLTIVVAKRLFMTAFLDKYLATFLSTGNCTPCWSEVLMLPLTPYKSKLTPISP